MNSITLSVVVRNEVDNIRNYVGKSFHLFDAVEITDTGSSDGTVELLRSEYGVRAEVFRSVRKKPLQYCGV